MTEHTVYSNGYQEWYQNDKLHREDGPALIHPDGSQFWYLNGIQYEPQDKFIIITNHNIKDGF